LLDRFRDSSPVYQGFAGGLGASKIDQLNDFSTSGLIPDLTLFLDVEPEIGLSRRRGTSEENYIDKRELKYHQDVYFAYKTLFAHDTENRWVRIDASKPIGEVYRAIHLQTRKHLREVGLLEGSRSGPERRG